MKIVYINIQQCNPNDFLFNVQKTYIESNHLIWLNKWLIYRNNIITTTII